MKVSTILDHIDGGSMALPEFQRGYVWNRDQVRGLMQSLYRKYPVGSLLVWVTPSESADARGDGSLAPGVIKMLLDGQQRVTSLYGIIRGAPPRFFDGNRTAFTGLYFHLDDETFEFFAPLKMKDNPRWIDVTALMKTGVADAVQRIVANPALAGNLATYINRINAIYSIREIDLHVEEVVGADKSLDVVVDIFNRVNSGGTKLSKGDLALAKLCAEWPEARDEMKRRLAKYQKAGFYFRLEWMLRAVNAVATGSAFFGALEHVKAAEFKAALERTEKRIDSLINLVAGRLGLDHDRVLGSRYSFPLMARYLDVRQGKLADHRERDRLLYWYVHSFLWGRYSGSTETVLAQDLAALAEGPEPFERLLALLRQQRGDLRVHPNDFLGASRGARFYPLLYMLTRVWQARDWDTGIPLASHTLGIMSALEVHHVFPKKQLRDHGYKIGDRNALANFTFLTKETNLRISARAPEDYFEEIEQKNPGVLATHWIPMDRALWKLDRYPDFLAARRELLAKAANDFLDGLIGGTLPSAVTEPATLVTDGGIVVSNAAQEAEDRILDEASAWLVEHGLPAGERNHELIDTDTGEVIATVDLAWPEGLQEGLSKKVALLIGESEDTLDTVRDEGFKCFTSWPSFRQYVEREVMAEGGEDEEDDVLPSREGWITRKSAAAVEMADKLVVAINEYVKPRFGREYELNYNRQFIGLTDGSRSRNFVFFKPRKQYLRVVATVAAPDAWAEKLAAAGLSTSADRSKVRVNVEPEQLGAAMSVLIDLVRAAADEHHA